MTAAHAQSLFTLAQVYANVGSCDNVYEDVGIRSESFHCRDVSLVFSCFVIVLQNWRC